MFQLFESVMKGPDLPGPERLCFKQKLKFWTDLVTSEQGFSGKALITALIVSWKDQEFQQTLYVSMWVHICTCVYILYTSERWESKF